MKCPRFFKRIERFLIREVLGVLLADRLGMFRKVLSCRAGFYAASEKVIVHLTRENTSKFFFADLSSTQSTIVQRQNFDNKIA